VDVDDPGTQVQLDGNTQRIEATTQVRNRAWNHDLVPDRSVYATSPYRLK
jgi:hypothetical protein